MAVDLHLHSTFSDGTEEPETIVQLAVDAGLEAIALTDHDNLNGIARAGRAADAAGIDLIAGAELSVGWGDTAMHLLVYFLDPGPGPMQDKLAEIQHGRATRNERIVGRLHELGMDITFDEISEEAHGTGIGRPHFAAVMVRKGYAADIGDAFDRFLAAGRPAYLPRERLDAVKAIELARASNAVPVIAHPHTLGVGAEDYAGAFQGLAEVGLGGIEAYYGEYEPALRDHIADLCDDLGIAATGGSDYHGTYKPNLNVGTGKGDLAVPFSAVEELQAQRAGNG
ncbi:MAG: PHP domain-containing protein [Acidimicrobiia bacterium]|nr:PHP domain-containing protein [Acidimicrobiia bacterium]